jgi:hypothetical protein
MGALRSTQQQLTASAEDPEDSRVGSSDQRRSSRHHRIYSSIHARVRGIRFHTAITLAFELLTSSMQLAP